MTPNECPKTATKDTRGPMTITAVVNEAHATACEKGWHDLFYDGTLVCADEDGYIVRQDIIDLQVGSWLALIQSEVSEALEAYRTRRTEAWEAGGKPEGFAAELADVIIRVADVCGALGIDLDAAVRQKLAFNKTRPPRHGGKHL